MIKSWSELKVRDYQKIVNISELNCGDDEKNLRVAAILAEMEYEDFIQLPLADIPQYMDNCEFLKEKPIYRKPRKHYKINDKDFVLLKDSVEMTVAQYIDFQTISVEGFERHIAEMLAIFLVPEGHTYNDGYNNDDVIEDVLDLNMEEAYNIASFFTKKCIRLYKRSLMYSLAAITTKKIMARKKEKEMWKAIELEMKLMVEELNSTFGLVLSKL